MGIRQSRVVALGDIGIVSRAKGGDGRTVEAYASVFGSPTEIQDRDGHYMEEIHPGAFRDLPPIGSVMCLYNHGRTLHGSSSEQGSVPIGHPVDIRSDSRGLLTVTQYNRSRLADDVLDAIKNGDVAGMSFTGHFQRSDPAQGPYEPSRSGALPLVTRKQIWLMEYGPTPIPAYSDATVLGVRYGGQLAAPGRSEPEDCLCPDCRFEDLLALGVTGPEFDRVRESRQRAYERFGQPITRPPGWHHAVAPDDDECARCGREGLIVPPGRSYFLCGDCWDTESRDRSDRATLARLQRQAAAEFLAKFEWDGENYRRRSQ